MGESCNINTHNTVKGCFSHFLFFYSSIHSLPLILNRVVGSLSSATIGREAGIPWTQSYALTPTSMGNLEGRKTEYPGRTHANIVRTCKLQKGPDQMMEPNSGPSCCAVLTVLLFKFPPTPVNNPNADRLATS